MSIDVLREDGVLAVRHAVLAKIARFHVGRDDSQIAAGDAASAAAAKSQSRGLRLFVPFGSRVALPGPLAGSRWRAAEMQLSCLLARVRVDFQRVVILPGDMHAHRD